MSGLIIISLILIIGVFAYGIAQAFQDAAGDLVSWRKVGGLYHWRIGRIGGSFYIKSVKSTRKPRGNRALTMIKAAHTWLTEERVNREISRMETIEPVSTVNADRIAFAMSTIRH